jgi:Zn-dependent peptidase ImmA (M78 family)
MARCTDIVSIGTSLRRQAGLKEPAFSTRHIVDACFPQAVVTGRHLPYGVQEVVSVMPEGPVILYDRALNTAAQRFAVAHACGHLLFDVDLASQGRGRGLVVEHRREARADRFALELLVPLAELARHVKHSPAARGYNRYLYLDHVDEIAALFGVEPHLIDKRVRELVIFDESAA